MAGVASHLRAQSLCSRSSRIEKKIAPTVAAQPCRVLHGNLQAQHTAALEPPSLVDRSLGGALAILDYEDSFLRPLAGFDEFPVGARFDEDVSEIRIRIGTLIPRFGVGHTKAGGKVRPFTIVLRAD